MTYESQHMMIKHLSQLGLIAGLCIASGPLQAQKWPYTEAICDTWRGRLALVDKNIDRWKRCGMERADWTPEEQLRHKGEKFENCSEKEQAYLNKTVIMLKYGEANRTFVLNALKEGECP